MRRSFWARVRPPIARSRAGSVRGQAVEAVDARDLLDQVGLALDVAVAEVRHLDLEVAVALLDAEAEPLEDRRGLSGSMRSPSRPSTRAVRSVDAGGGGGSGAATSIVAGHHPRAAELDHQPRGEPLGARARARDAAASRSGALASVRRPSFVEVWRMFGPFQVAASIATRVVSRRRPRCAAPPMIPPMPVGPSASQTSTASRVEHALLAVERHEALALARARARASAGPATWSRS